LYKRIAAILAVSAIALSGCGDYDNEWSSQSNVRPVNTGTQYAVITDWTKIPADGGTKDIVIRILKIEGVCYIHSYTVYDTTLYQLTPTGKDCGPKS
jgi:hypothetical protein